MLIRFGINSPALIDDGKINCCAGVSGPEFEMVYRAVNDHYDERSHQSDQIKQIRRQSIQWLRLMQQM